MALNDTDAAVELLATLDQDDPSVKACTLLAEHVVRFTSACVICHISMAFSRAPAKACWTNSRTSYPSQTKVLSDLWQAPSCSSKAKLQKPSTSLKQPKKTWSRMGHFNSLSRLDHLLIPTVNYLFFSMSPQRRSAHSDFAQPQPDRDCQKGLQGRGCLG